MAKKRYTQHTHPGLTISAFITVLILIFGCVLGGMQLWGKDKIKPSNWGKKNQPATEQKADAGMTINPDEQAPAATGISFVSTAIPREQFAANEISPDMESAQQIKATVTPPGAEDAVLDWSVAWKDGTSGKWGNGKTVTDYVTVTPVSDGALTANVACAQAFGEQVIITAAIRGNAGVKGTCTVDYKQRYDDFTVSGTCSTGIAAWEFGAEQDVTLQWPAAWTTLDAAKEAISGDNLTGTTVVTPKLCAAYTIAADPVPEIAEINFVTTVAPALQEKLSWYTDQGGDSRGFYGLQSSENANFYNPAICAYAAIDLQYGLFAATWPEQLTAEHYLEWQQAMKTLDAAHFTVTITASIPNGLQLVKTYSIHFQ